MHDREMMLNGLNVDNLEEVELAIHNAELEVAKDMVQVNKLQESRRAKETMQLSEYFMGFARNQYFDDLGLCCKDEGFAAAFCDLLSKDGDWRSLLCEENHTAAASSRGLDSECKQQ